MPDCGRVHLDIQVRTGAPAPDPDDVALCRWLTSDQRRLLAAMDNVWATANEIRHGLRTLRSPPLELAASRVTGMLRTLRHEGLADYRVSDAHGRGEWARTERGDRVVASWEGTRWMP